MASFRRAVAVAAVAAAAVAAAAPAVGLQKPERHFGCPPGKNVCIYPIDTAAMQTESLFDFQVELHVLDRVPVAKPVTQELAITIKLPSGETTTPEALFPGVSPVYRTWDLKAFKDMSDENPVGYDSYAATWRNVFIPKAVGGGALTVSVMARNVTTAVTYDIRKPTTRKAKNVILFIGDGMSLTMMSAARLVSRGMYHGKYKDKLTMQQMDNIALLSTSGVGAIISDSANTASTYHTGHKTSVNALGVYADSGDDTFAHPKQELLTEYVKQAMGMKVGIVTTAQVQDATPASAYSHVRRRGEKAAITSQAINGCASCVLPVMPDVLMGGGGKYFLPDRSIDGSNMFDKYAAKGYTVTHTAKDMAAAASNPATKKLLTISHRSNMDVWLDRHMYTNNLRASKNDPTGEGKVLDQPDLEAMSMAALEVLTRDNDNGFYLLIEAASVDKSSHSLDTPRALADLIELDNTVAKVLEWTKKNGDNTLVLATADHSHSFDVYGTVDTKLWQDSVVASESNPVRDTDNYCATVTDNNGHSFASAFGQGKNSARSSNLARRSAIGTYASAGYPDYVNRGDNFPVSWDVRTTLASGFVAHPDHTTSFSVSTSTKDPADKHGGVAVNVPEDDPNGIFMSGNLPPKSSSGVHSMADVGVFASGPGSERVRGMLDSTDLYHIMASALGVGTDGRAGGAPVPSGTAPTTPTMPTAPTTPVAVPTPMPTPAMTAAPVVGMPPPPPSMSAAPGTPVGGVTPPSCTKATASTAAAVDDDEEDE